MHRKEWNLFANFWPVCGLPKELFSVLPDSELRRGQQRNLDLRLKAKEESEWRCHND
jgi:hypothetical protein